MPEQLYWWIGFHIFIFLMLALDLGVFHRKSHTVTVREALTWSAVWISLALIFNAGVFFVRGYDSALEFLAGYLLEESLSVDNLFVFLLLFSYFKVPADYQHKVLFWGIVGALVMRALFIGIGAVLIAQFHYILYLFGIFLVITGVRMAFDKGDEVNPENNILVKVFRRFFPVSDKYDGSKFFTLENGERKATLLFIVLLIVEATDILFAVDSIPAVFAVTQDPFIVYTSNIFAILGLRSLYFALAGIMNLFHYLKFGLSIILSFIGVKMLIMDIYKIPIGAALGFVIFVLVASIVASKIWPQGSIKEPEANEAEIKEADQNA
ncbi:MAG: TerC family protein [Ignavibacteria bacterium]|nr:TerC family protein [Ignavibacteria bacterium]MBL7992780.1 TerC family protein [Candidatus Kapabacteria bacterium]